MTHNATHDIKKDSQETHKEHQDACVAVVVLFLQTHAREHDATSANTNLCESTRKTQKPLFKRTYFFFSIGSLASLAFHTKL